MQAPTFARQKRARTGIGGRHSQGLLPDSVWVRGLC